MKTSTVIAPTKKGHRIWLEGVPAQRFTVLFTEDVIVVTLGPHGKRKVTQSKGGIIDITSQKVTQWAQGHSRATVEMIGNVEIRIRRA
jgi:hypothetical protein